VTVGYTGNPAQMMEAQMESPRDEEPGLVVTVLLSVGIALAFWWFVVLVFGL